MNPKTVFDDENCCDEKENSTQNLHDNIANESILKENRFI
jgi:hypothetical protein